MYRADSMDPGGGSSDVVFAIALRCIAFTKIALASLLINFTVYDNCKGKLHCIKICVIPCFPN